MSEERKGYFFVVFDWMLTDLKLSGYQAFIYAAIYNYSQDPNGCFSGSISYLQKALGASRNAVISALSDLVRKGLIAKKETIINGVKFNTYRSTNRDCTSSSETALPVQKQYKPSAETALGGSAETAPNNKDNIIKDNKVNPPFIPPFNESVSGTSPGALETNPRKRKTRLPENRFLPKDCGDWALEPEPVDDPPPRKPEKPQYRPLADLINRGVDGQTALDWVEFRRGKKAKPTKTAIDGIEREAIKAGMSLQDALTICCANGWQGFRAEWVKDRGKQEESWTEFLRKERNTIDEQADYPRLDCAPF